MHLGLIGYGSIATSLIELLATTRVKDLTILVRASSRAKIQSASLLDVKVPRIHVVTSLHELTSAKPDLVVECAGHSAVDQFVPQLLEAGLDVIVASIGAFADKHLHTLTKIAAAQGNSNVILPSGAIGGLDILGSISQMGDIKLKYRGVKPVKAWLGTPAEEIVDLNSLKEPIRIFCGTGREAALAFPKNANVVAALALAGGGFDKMTVELVADPDTNSNEHSYSVLSAHCRYSMTIEATPSKTNTRTSFTTVLSILKEISDYQIRPTSR